VPAKQSLDYERLHNVATVTVSPKFKIENPREMREAMGLKPGQRFQAFQFGNRIELIPWIPMRKTRGSVAAAYAAAGLMHRGKVVPLNGLLAVDAACLSKRLRLPMADSIILATANAHGATLWTQDKDFACIEGVKYIEKAH